MGEMVFEYFFAKGAYLAMEGVTESEPFGGKVEASYAAEQGGVYGRVIHGRVILNEKSELFFQTLFCQFHKTGIQFRSDEISSEFPCHDSSRSASHERVKYDSVFGAAGFDAGFDKLFGEDGEVRTFERLDRDRPNGSFVFRRIIVPEQSFHGSTTGRVVQKGMSSFVGTG